MIELHSASSRTISGARLLLLSSIAAAASGMLVLQHVAAMRLPGCGPTSACAQLAASRWGSVAGWPVSFIGFAYFSGLVAAAAATRRHGLPSSARWLVAAGGLVSLGFLGLMAAESKWCVYCLAVHAANLVMTALALLSPRAEATQGGRRWWTSLAATATLVSVLLAIVSHQQAERVRQEQLAQTEISIKQAISGLEQSKADDEGPPADGGFTGRRLRGLQEAAVRLVVFHDYQCKDCAELDAELDAMLEEHPTLSLTIGHYPMCASCNPDISWEFFHKEACQAAYLAESAARLGGEKAFWTVHRWLFERKAKYTDDEVRQLASDLDLDAQELRRLSQSQQVKRVVDDDIAKARTLGATGTPFVFLNGVEVRGASSSPGNVRLAVERVLSEDPPLRTAAWDRTPPGADDRLLAEWLSKEPVALPDRDAARFVLGNPDAEERILLFLEPTSSDSQTLWKTVTALLARRNDVRLEVFLYPISRELNPRFAKRTTDYFPRSTSATRLLEGAVSVDGPSCFARCLPWLLEQDLEGLTYEACVNVGGELGIDSNGLQAAIASPDLLSGLDGDLRVAAEMGVTWVPTLYVRGRRDPSSSVSAGVIERMLDGAAQLPQ